MAKVIVWGADKGFYTFECPGCKIKHNLTDAVHRFNGDVGKPTFTPSVLFETPQRCHSFVTLGRIRFLDDSTHELKGQSVDLPEIHNLD
jgi:hypothetical protein